MTGLGDDTVQVPCAGAVQACAEQLSRRASAATRPWMLQEHLPRHVACSCTDHLTHLICAVTPDRVFCVLCVCAPCR